MHIEFLEDDQSSWPDVTNQFSKRRKRIRAVHQDEATDDCVKRPVEYHFGSIAFDESDVRDSEPTHAIGRFPSRATDDLSFAGTQILNPSTVPISAKSV